MCVLPPAAIVDDILHGVRRCTERSEVSQPVSLTKSQQPADQSVAGAHPGCSSHISPSRSNLSIVSVTREPSRFFFPHPLLFTALLFLHSLFPPYSVNRCPLPVCRRVVRIAVCLFLSRLSISSLPPFLFPSLPLPSLLT